MSEREHRVPQPAAEREIAERLATVRVGCLLALLVGLGAAAYSLLTWVQPHRDLLLLLSGVAVLSAAVVAALPTERIVRGPWREPFFIVWSGFYVALTATGIAFDGGIASPFALMLVMPLLFGAISYPLRGAVIVGVFSVIAYLVVALSSGEELVISITGAFVLATTVLLCSWLARDQAARRDDLARTAEALRQAEERTRHEALHDPLTGLANRNLFFDRLGHALAQSARRESSVAVLFLDLDQFKLVNDSLGHSAGDELLRAVGERFIAALRPEDTVARFGGDEFAVLVEDVEAERDATRVAERIAESLSRPFIVRRREHFVSVSVGISIGRGGERPEALIRNADAALYRAKERGRGRYEIFDAVMRARAVAHMQTENDLRRALDRGEFELHYQPLISLADGSVAALEALLRWRHPDRGLITPDGFLQEAEDSQLIRPIGYRAVGEACGAAATWQALEPDRPPIRVAINLSAHQLADPELPRVLEAAIAESGIEALSIDLEMTESALLEESETPERSLERLKQVGVRLVLDDFGTGFSSLGHLRRFPLDAIKLDRSIIENLGDGSADPSIVHAIVELAGALELDVAAEGVESEEQLGAVRGLGCNLAQGFLFSPPVSRDQLDGLLAEQPWGDLSVRTV